MKNVTSDHRQKTKFSSALIKNQNLAILKEQKSKHTRFGILLIIYMLRETKLETLAILLYV